MGSEGFCKTYPFCELQSHAMSHRMETRDLGRVLILYSYELVELGYLANVWRIV